MKSPRVLIGADICDDFIARCAGEYHNAERNCHAPRQWAILAGRITDDSIVVQALYDGTNVRDTDHAVILEYRAERAPRFGGVYTDLRRGYLCHPTDLLAVMRKAEAADQQVLGSVHMHADLHNLDRPDELSPTITEKSAVALSHLLGLGRPRLECRPALSSTTHWSGAPRSMTTVRRDRARLVGRRSWSRGARPSPWRGGLV